jgi:hypothetical protein
MVGGVSRFVQCRVIDRREGVPQIGTLRCPPDLKFVADCRCCRVAVLLPVGAVQVALNLWSLNIIFADVSCLSLVSVRVRAPEQRRELPLPQSRPLPPTFITTG